MRVPIPCTFPRSSNWTGGQPTLQPDGTVTATDTFTGEAYATDYYYGVNVTLQDPASGAQQTFNYDPEVENEAASLSH